MKIKVCVVTGSRAEYGILYPLLTAIEKDPAFDLQIIATGMHLSRIFGSTYKEILTDGFPIAAKVPMLIEDDTDRGVTKSIGTGIIRFADVWKKARPDAVILLGDRFEIFAAAVAAYVAQLPIVHLYGGELTEGAFDDAFRHSITKMSMLHCVSADEYRKRVIQLGENPNRVFTVGALGIDNIVHASLLTKNELERDLRFRFGKRNILVTFHPVTLGHRDENVQLRELLRSLADFKDTSVIFTRPNADINGRIIMRMIDQFVDTNRGRATAFTSLGRERYLSMLQHVDAVLGNSSSGIIEVPHFGIPTVNVGSRQKGRIRPSSVIDCQPEYKSIVKALRRAFSSDFRALCKTVKNPYGDGRAAQRIVRTLKKQLPGMTSLSKEFYRIRVNDHE